MKKILLFLLILSLVFITSIIFLIQSPIKVSGFTKIKCNENSCRNYFVRKKPQLLKWLSSEIILQKDSSFLLHDLSFKMINSFSNGIDFLITNKSDSTTGRLSLIKYKSDSSILQFETIIQTTKNPINKLSKYLFAKNVKKGFSEILHSLNKFLENEENIYSINIQRTNVKNTIVLTTDFSTDHYPSVKDIYTNIDQLKSFLLKDNTVTMVDSVMLHVSQKSVNLYETMIALPINKEIHSNGKIVVQKMFPGHLLYTSIKGGTNNISKALLSLEEYIEDYHLTSPAIPYQSLITNRMQEPDSSKWITSIYYPIY